MGQAPEPWLSGLLADIYWTRAVQYFGGKRSGPKRTEDYRLLYPLLQITSELDPQLTWHTSSEPISGTNPPEGAGRPDQAIALVEHGIQNNPDNWKLYYELGFIYYYMESKNYAKAAESFERGTKVPNAHPFLRILAAQMAQHAGEIQTSRMLWQAAYATTQDPTVRHNATSTCVLCKWTKTLLNWRRSSLHTRRKLDSSHRPSTH